MNRKRGIWIAPFFLAANLFSQDVHIEPGTARRSAQEALQPTARIRANANLVLVPTHVTNRAGGAVNGLDITAFTVLEDKVPQTIVSFGNEDAPCSVGVIFDLSGSMQTKLNVAASALHAFMGTANPDDEAFLLTVSTTPQNVSDFTTDFGLLESRLLAVRPGGATALIDTIYLGLDRMRTARHTRKALLILSDGMDNHSRYSSQELMRRVEEANVQIYAIGIETWSPFRKPIELTEERNGQAFLQALADRSGGLISTIRSFDEASRVAARFSLAIRDQYVIGYRPAAKDDSGKWRAIQVRVNVPETRVSSRTGYYSR